MTHQLSELIDLAALQALMESLYRATGIKHALIDNDGTILTAAGWETVCTEFHRADPKTCRRCLESDRQILENLRDGPYVGYVCGNGLVDYATPVVIDGMHMANVFTGQMLHEPPDLDFFRRQAAEFGFPEGPYLEAVRRVPVVPRERMPDIMAFLVGLAQMLGQQGLARVRQLDAERALRGLNQDLAERVRQRTEELSERNRLLSHKILELEQTQDALREEMQFSDDTINSLPGIFYMLDETASFARWNRKFCEVTGYCTDEMMRLHALELFTDDTRSIVQERIMEVFAQGEASVEAPLLTRDGRLIPYYFTGRRTVIGGQAYLVGLGIDITERKALECELARQAHEDSLTGLANRRRFLELAETELRRTRRYGSLLSFLVLDVDRFKEINDRYGHAVGDRLLQALADIFRNTLRAVDIVGRLGGDEFAIILPETDGDEALEAADRLRLAVACLEMPVPDGIALRCTVSIGTTTLGPASDGIDALFREADEALYRAKRDGRNRVSMS